MKRLINFRAALVAAVCFVLGIFAFYELLFGEFYFGLAVLLLIAGVGVFCVFKRNGVWKIAVVALVFVLLGFGRSYWYYSVQMQNEVCSESVLLCGRVTDLARNGSTNFSVYYLDECTDEQGNEYGGIVRVSFAERQTLSVGDKVQVRGELNSVYSVKQDVSGFDLRNDIRYEINNAALLVSSKGSVGTDETIRRYIYDSVTDMMPNNSAIMYALLTGDRNAMSAHTEWAFSRAGIVHLLAVSGLHVGFLATLFGFVLKKLKAPIWLESIAVMAPVAFYAYICSFTPSVVRAMIMLACGYITQMLFRRRDMLTALSQAALITLCICPFYIFDVGFQLSFLAVFGIATLHQPLCRFLARKKVNRYLSAVISSLSLSACCMCATLFAVFAQGGEAALFGVLLNLIAIPFVSVALALGVFGMIPWVFRYLLVAADAILQTVVRCAEAIADIGFATVSLRAVPLAVIFVILLLFVLGGYVNLGKWCKRIFLSLCCVAVAVCCVLNYVRSDAQTRAIVVQTENDSIVAALSEDGSAAIVGDFADYSAASDAMSMLNGFRVEKLSLYISHFANADPHVVESVIDAFDVDNVFLLNNEANNAVWDFLAQKNVQTVRLFPNEERGQGIAVRSVYDGDLRAVSVTVKDIRLCLVYGTEKQISSALRFGIDAELYVLSSSSEQFSRLGLTTLTPFQSRLPHNYGANKYGNFTITQKGDTIKLGFR